MWAPIFGGDLLKVVPEGPGAVGVLGPSITHAVKFGPKEPGTVEVGILQIGMGEIGVGQVSAAQIGAI